MILLQEVQRAVLVHDAKTERLWWQEPWTMQLVVEASLEQVTAILHYGEDGWRQAAPRFVHDRAYLSCICHM